MLNMSQINHIRDLKAGGYSVSEISRMTGVDRKTIRKYLAMENFSPEVPLQTERPSKLDPFKEIIDRWLEEDKKRWYKQQHTAKRVLDRLVEEHQFQGSYSTVQRYVKQQHEIEQTRRANQELVWEPGSAQADFGEADFIENGMEIRKKFLVLSFPYSNDGFCQVFGGETAECVCQGLLDIFYYIGGVPHTIVFDNATGVGRRVCNAVHETKLFARFRAHHRFEARFCNPRSGWEKGNVERKVGYDRSNLFVPVEPLEDIENYNRKLLDKHTKKASENHYKKGAPICVLFKEDQEALHPLPGHRFDVCDYVFALADGYGKVHIDGEHYYSTRPEYACRRDVLVGIRAHYIDIYDEKQKLLVRHSRCYGNNRTDSCDYSTTLALLMHRPGAWKNSGVRLEMPDPLRNYMDHLEKPKLKDCLQLLNNLTISYGFYPAIAAMDWSLQNGKLNSSDATIVAGRICQYGLDTPPAKGPDLDIYDKAFLSMVRKGGVVA